MNESYLSSYGLSRSLNSQNTYSQRKFSKLDVPPSRPAEYTTMYTQTHHTSTVQTQDKDAYSPHPGSVVIEAFKDLQRKVKSMEEERYQVC
ncbi:hypothetical protein EON64_03840 [archaeon]|nr:MAG: hypothetical protein EON64_03840 [archaeon]